jgi:hypothetical protein
VPGLTYALGSSGLVNGDTLTDVLAASTNAIANTGSYGITRAR